MIILWVVLWQCRLLQTCLLRGTCTLQLALTGHCPVNGRGLTESQLDQQSIAGWGRLELGRRCYWHTSVAILPVDSPPGVLSAIEDFTSTGSIVIELICNSRTTENVRKHFVLGMQENHPVIIKTQFICI